jgi:cytoskeletal protein CcmA (bactofilin family)
LFTRKPNQRPADQLQVSLTGAPAVASAVTNVSGGDPSRSISVSGKENGITSVAGETEGIVVIGRGTKISGQIADCAKLEIQGTVEGTIVADSIVVREGGVVKGEVRAVHAEIHGLFEGQLVVQDTLDVRGTGHVEGDLSYGKLAVAMGGYISGKVSGEAVTGARTNAAGQATTSTLPVPRALIGLANGHAH